MILQRSHKNKRYMIFRQFLVSYYLLVMAVVLIISFFLAAVLTSKLRNEADNIASNNIMVISDFFETKFMEMDRISFKISEDVDMAPFSVFNDGYNNMKSTSELNSYCEINTYITDIALYYDAAVTQNYGSQPKFITANGTYSTKSFWEFIYPFSDWNYTDFEGEIKDITSPRIRYPVNVIRKDIKETYLVYMSPFSTVSGKNNNRGVILFMIDQKGLDTFIKSLLQNHNGSLRVFNETGQLIYNLSDQDAVSSASFPMETATAGEPVIDQIELNQTSYIRVHICSSGRNWTYVMDIPQNDYVIYSFGYYIPFFIWLLPVLILGLVGAYLLSEQKYRPIGRLFDIFTKYNKKKEINIDNVAITLDEIEQINHKMQIRIRKTQDLCRLQFIQNLIHGRFHSQQALIAQQEECNITFAGTNFVVLVIHIISRDVQSGEMQPPYREEIKDSVISTLENHYTARGIGAWGISLGPNQGGAIVLNLDTECIDRNFLNETDTLNKFIRNEYSVELTIGIGRLYQNPRDIYLSYKEALDAVSFQFVKGCGRVYVSDQINDSYHNKLHWYPKDEEINIFRLIIEGHYELLRNIINNIIDRVEEMILTPYEAYSICSGLTNTARNVITEMNLEIDQEMVDQLNNLLSIEYDTIRSFEEDYLLFCSRLCSLIISSRESKKEQLKNEVIHYLNTYYNDNSLTLTSIAQQFSVSPGYLTRYFKSYTGSSLMRYLDDIRMNNAKKLLKETSLPLNDIMYKCGYCDKNNFIRKFKKYNKYTPISYRKNLSNE